MKKQHFTLHELGMIAVLILVFGFYSAAKHNSGFLICVTVVGLVACFIASSEHDTRNDSKG